jgi:hypothetical protein
MTTVTLNEANFAEKSIYLIYLINVSEQITI